VELPKAFCRVSLIATSSLSWFIDNIWPTIWVGSIGEVGSCDWSSVTRRLINADSASLAAEFGVVEPELEFAAAAECDDVAARCGATGVDNGLTIIELLL
jgi:hypothetical protein